MKGNSFANGTGADAGNSHANGPGAQEFRDGWLILPARIWDYLEPPLPA